MKDNPNDADSPIWEAEDFRQARPASDLSPAHLASLLSAPPAVALKDQVARQPALARGLKIAA